MQKKTSKTSLILGIIFIIMQCISYIGRIIDGLNNGFDSPFIQLLQGKLTTFGFLSSIGSIIGSNIFLLLGVLLIIIYIRKNKNIRQSQNADQKEEYYFYYTDGDDSEYDYDTLTDDNQSKTKHNDKDINDNKD